MRKNLFTPKSTVPGSSASLLLTVPAGLEAKCDHSPCIMGAETFAVFSLFSRSTPQSVSLGIEHPK